MSEIRSHPWKFTAIAMALISVTALASGLVVANWSSRESQQKAEMPAASPTTVAEPQASRPATTTATPPAAPAAPPRVAGPPPQAVVNACNEQAARQAGAQPEQRDKVLNVAKDAGIGALGGAAVGALGGAVVKGGKGAGKGAAIGGVLGAGGGAL